MTKTSVSSDKNVLLCLYRGEFSIVPYLEFFLCAGLNVVTGFLGLDNNSVLVHAVCFGHVLVTEQATVGNVGGVDGCGEEQEGQDTWQQKNRVTNCGIIELFKLIGISWKVKKSWKQFMVSSILPKNERKNEKKST